MTIDIAIQDRAHPSVAAPQAQEFDTIRLLLARWKLFMAAPLAGATLAVATSFLIPPLFTARTLLIPPQQQQGGAASALASLSALSGLASGLGSVKTTADQFVALMQSANVEDRIIERFKLVEAYDVDKKHQARERLERRVRIALGKKDGLIGIEVDDTEPQRAADIANQYVEELRRLSSELALTEAQQRRKFFEGELRRAQSQLSSAQEKLQRSGFNAGAIKAEPKAAAEAYAKLRADATAAQVKLRTLRSMRAESAPEVQQQLAQVNALEAELKRLEAAASTRSETDYLGNYRDFKYYETLFELLSKQYELARLDEAREGALIQVVDVATAPEHKSFPKRSMFAGLGAAAALLISIIYVLVQPLWSSAMGAGASKKAP